MKCKDSLPSCEGSSESLHFGETVPSWPRDDGKKYRWCFHRRTDRVKLPSFGRGGLRVQDFDGQATKGIWGMSWRQETMKGVEVCEKLGEADKRAMIPRYPNVAC